MRECQVKSSISRRARLAHLDTVPETPERPVGRINVERIGRAKDGHLTI
jgi:hypothetical protein